MRRTVQASDWGAMAGLSVLAAVTRLPLAGRSLGEPDGARYALGLEQWLRRGPAAPFIYAKVLSPGYYALAAWWIRHSGQVPLHVLDAWSWLAALASAPLLYWLGRQFTSRGVAAAGAALFLLAPGVWWLGIEPHPQGISFLCLLAAVAYFTAMPDWRGELAAIALLASGLLLKNDLVLFVLVFPALRLSEDQPSVRRVLRALWVPAAASITFLVVRAPLLHMAWGRAQGETSAVVMAFLNLPRGVELLKQILPMLTSPGLATLALTASGLILGWRLRGDREFAAWLRRWRWLVAAWAAPGTIFWLLIHGNNARHMAPLLLLPLWTGLDAWTIWTGRRVGGKRQRLALAMTALGLVVSCNWLLPPASSNMSLFPSGNVPASLADLIQRTSSMNAWMRAELQGDRPPCFVGNPTLPYLELAIEQSQPGITARELNAPIRREALQIGYARFFEVNSSVQAAGARELCRSAGAGAPRSLEYTAAGVHRRFFGQEWSWLPFARRWYPADALHVRQPLRH